MSEEGLNENLKEIPTEHLLDEIIERIADTSVKHLLEPMISLKMIDGDRESGKKELKDCVRAYLHYLTDWLI